MTDLEWRKMANAVLAVRRMRGELQPLAATEAGLGQVNTSLVKELEQVTQTIDNAVALFGTLDEYPFSHQ